MRSEVEASDSEVNRRNTRLTNLLPNLGVRTGAAYGAFSAPEICLAPSGLVYIYNNKIDLSK